MNNRELIEEATKIIEKNLKAPLSIKVLSEKIGYSLFHFIRLFSGVLGCTPKEYLAARRLCSAARDVLSGDKVLDVALEYQFSSSEAFSRAFKKVLGVSPANFKKNGSLEDIYKNPFAIPYSSESSNNIEQFNREPEVIELDSMLLAGRIVTVGDDHTVIGKLWGEFVQIPPPGGIENPPKFTQCSFWNPEENDGNAIHVMTAYVVDHMEFNSFVYKQIPKARYLRFPHYGPCENIITTYNWLFSNWLPEKNYKLTLPYSLEMYTNHQAEIDNDISAWILLPLKEIK